MRLLTSTDIALRVLMHLALRRAAGPVTVERLAAELGGLSRDHLHKIVQDLSRLGLTRTLRGVAGGVVLEAAPGAIRLGRLIRHLENGQAMVACFRDESCDCTFLPRCGLRVCLAAAEEQFYRSLDEHTLADCLPAGGVRDHASRGVRQA